MSKKLPTFLLISTLGAAAALAYFAPQSAEAGGTTDCAKVKDGKVKKVCTDVGGDKTKIKKQMKAWQKAVKEKGKNFACKDCHKDGNDGGALEAGALDKWKEGTALVPFPAG